MRQTNGCATRGRLPSAELSGLSADGNLSQRGAPLGRFVEYLVAYTLTTGPADELVRSVLHWGMRGVFGSMLIERYGVKAGFAFLGREPVEVLKHAVAGPRVGPVHYDARHERHKAQQLTRLLAGIIGREAISARGCQRVGVSSGLDESGAAPPGDSTISA